MNLRESERPQSERDSLTAYYAFLSTLANDLPPAQSLDLIVNALFAHRNPTFAVLVSVSPNGSRRSLGEYAATTSLVERLCDERIFRDHPLMISLKTGEIYVEEVGSLDGVRRSLYPKSVSSVIHVPIRSNTGTVAILIIAFSDQWTLLESESCLLKCVSSAFALKLQRVSISEKSDSSRESKEHLASLGLSERQISIALMISDGLSNGEIAENLGFSEATVRYETVKLYERLRVKNRAHAAARVRDLDK